MTIGLVLYTLLVLGLTAAEYKQDRRAQYFLKPLAALGFIIMAVKVGALESLYGQIILGGLIACAIGDILLLSRQSQKLFLAGMAAFAVGHFAYLSAFVPYEGQDFGAMGFVIDGLIILSAVGFYSWLKPKLPDGMKWPVLGYTAIIMFMVLNAIDLPVEHPKIFALVGAILFAISDMFVARDRFVKSDPINALAITPLYFTAQALIALSVAT